MWNGVYTMPPDLYLPQYSDGRWGWSSWSTKVNPVAAVYNLGVRQTRTTELNSITTWSRILILLSKV